MGFIIAINVTTQNNNIQEYKRLSKNMKDTYKQRHKIQAYLTNPLR